MGSPNFYTGNNLLANYGIDEFFFGDDADDALNGVVFNKLKEANEEVQSYIDKMPRLYFHEVVFRNGYHSGFQLYLEGNYGNDLDGYVKRTQADFERYECTTDTNGYEFELFECEHFRSNIKTPTFNNIKQGIIKERKMLENLLKETAAAIGMGEVIGLSWTSSVRYPS